MDVGLVCDSCSAFNPMGVKTCARCGVPISLDDPDAKRSFDDGETRLGIAPGPSGRAPCPECGSDIIAGHRFCGSCGYRVPGRDAPTANRALASQAVATAKRRVLVRSTKRTQFFGAMQEARAKLVVIRGDGMDGVSFTLAGQEHLVGRYDTPILFEDDVFISPVHANFYYDLNNLMVRDEQSTNGVYIRIHGAVEIGFGDRFLVGEQVLEVQPAPSRDAPEAMDDGTYYFASPASRGYFRVVQALLGGATGMAYRATKSELTIGREGNDIDFPDDPFISGHHAKLTLSENKLILTDLDSKNGTFLRINGEHALKHGDYVFMGQQLLRVEIV